MAEQWRDDDPRTNRNLNGDQWTGKLNSSGIGGFVNGADNPGFPLHTFSGKGPKCRRCGLIRYKAVHAETAESEARRGRA